MKDSLSFIGLHVIYLQTSTLLKKTQAELIQIFIRDTTVGVYRSADMKISRKIIHFISEDLLPNMNMNMKYGYMHSTIYRTLKTVFGIMTSGVP